MNRNLIIEDAISPMIERAKIAIGTFGARAEAHFSAASPVCLHGHMESCAICEARQDAWAAILADGHPTREEIRVAFRGRGLSTVTHEEVRAVLIRAMLRDSPEMRRRKCENLPPAQRLARTVAAWIMEAFDEASWMSEEEAMAVIATARPHTLAG